MLAEKKKEKKNNEANWMVSNSAKLDCRTKQHTQSGVSMSDGSRDMARTKVAEKKKKKNERRQSHKASPTYLLNSQNIKIYDTKEQTKLYKEFWQDIFRINPEENANYDQVHEEEINSFIIENINRIKPFETADLTRLDPNVIMIKPITVDDIKRIIKSFKHKAPGQSKINKLILENLPEQGYKCFAKILNYTISMGYFPIILKEGIIILILKPGKDPTKVASYRPITLLEVPGKILERYINESPRICRIL